MMTALQSLRYREKFLDTSHESLLSTLLNVCFLEWATTVLGRFHPVKLRAIQCSTEHNLPNAGEAATNNVP